MSGAPTNPTVNLAILLGTLGTIPEEVPLPDGTLLVRARLVTTETWTDRTTNAPRSRDSWHRLSASGEIGTQLMEVPKGAYVYLQGVQRPQTFKDRAGTTQVAVDVDVRLIRVLRAPSESPPEEDTAPKAEQAQPASDAELAEAPSSVPDGSESSAELASPNPEPEPEQTPAPGSHAPTQGDAEESSIAYGHSF
ncbi:single-stranded DNA-binding protein [Sinimarinibacterium sp. CAU 1509]|uniref:single-stranded DNA-binding protein n=1 Tax=Sinimarinibacterium sp. CAU 1509 TaxID=2562283 RepID=UPI00146A0FC5|nr:single-stranded DNA-binding protein [Sinimarinibacterium sp. CAU 1509]